MANDFQQDANEFGAVATETTYATDSFGGNAPTLWTRFRSIEIVPQIELRTEDAATATDTPERGIPVPMRCQVNWSVPLFATNDDVDEHELSALLRCSKLKRTIVAGPPKSIDYDPHSGNDMANTPSATFVKYEISEDRNVKKLIALGCRSTLEINLQQGQIAFLQGEARGRYTAEQTSWAAPPTLPTAYSGDELGMAVTNLALIGDAGGTPITFKISQAVLKSNYTLTEIMGGGGAGVVSDVLLHKPKSGAPWTVDFTLDGGAAAMAKVISMLQTGDVLDFVATLVRGDKRLTITMPAGQIAAFQKQGNGIKQFQATLHLVRNPGTAGDNDLKLRWDLVP